VVTRMAVEATAEPSDRKGARVASPEVGHPGAAVGSAARSQVAARFFEEDVFLRFGPRQGAAIDGDLIAIGVGAGPRLADDVAVDGDASLDDEAISSPP